MLFKAPRGTRDILPEEIADWQRLESLLREICHLYGYSEIRTPLFEQTELFTRSVGEGTDIVEKEMYTFKDRGNRSLTLRPENTAPVARAYLEHNLLNEPQPVKMYYLGPMFRYDRPQAGRYRQFHQFGIEAFGSQDALLDGEIIAVGQDFFRRLGLDNLLLAVNSVGCSTCRPQYQRRLQEYFIELLPHLCDDCRNRYQHNPLRILDCKEEKCAPFVAGAPTLIDHLCEECCSHFHRLQEILTFLGIDFTLNARLVRGLDYYTKTAFEFVLPNLGSQSALGGGGRYDDLVEICGGPPTPGVGMAIGLERVLLAIKSSMPFKEPRDIMVFVALTGRHLDTRGAALVQEIRNRGIRADMDFLGRSLKGQMKYAGKKNFSHVILLGDEELSRGVVILREMIGGNQEEIPVEKAASYLEALWQSCRD